MLSTPQAGQVGAHAAGVAREIWRYAMMAGLPSSSSGPGRRPFKAVARVRIPLGVRPTQVGQFVRRKVLWSSWSARRPVKAEVAGSSPVRTAKRHHGQVAQLVRASD